MRHVFLGSAIVACLNGSVPVALADGIEITGSAEMGLAGGTREGTGGTARTTLLSDLDLQIRMSRTTDSGLTFALELDLDDLDARSGTMNQRGSAFPPGN